MLFQKQAEKLYRRRLFVRKDNTGCMPYFGPEDFSGLQVHPYSFRAKAGHTLKGYFYHYDASIPGRILVFDHGMGNGHRAYMRELERLARGGFLVFAYDHTGCMESGGESINGFAQSLSDLDDCLTALKAEYALKDRTFSVMGHSWGGYSAMNIPALHPEITHVVAMCGYLSVAQIQKQTVRGLLSVYRSSLYALESRINPAYVSFRAEETLKSTNARVLLIYSSDDTLVNKKLHFDVLQKALTGQENIRFLLLHGKDHNPTYTADAVSYRHAFFSEWKRQSKHLHTDAQKKAFMARFDWHRMTEQDDSVWAAILDALKSSPHV